MHRVRAPRAQELFSGGGGGGSLADVRDLNISQYTAAEPHSVPTVESK